jgi:single-stranded DNA-binding protein
MLAVVRRYGRADYLPCIAWGSAALACSEYSTATKLRLEGRIQSRRYTKDINGIVAEKTAYEVSISKVGRVDLNT